MSEKERIILTLETAVGILTPQEREPRTEMDWWNFAVSARAILNGLIGELGGTLDEQAAANRRMLADME